MGANHILKVIRDVWQVEQSVLESFDGGFNWWPGHHKATVRCQNHDNPGESEAWRILVETDYIKDVNFLDLKTTQIRIIILAKYYFSYSTGESRLLTV